MHVIQFYSFPRGENFLKYWVKRAFFVNIFKSNCDDYTTKRINMQEEFRIFFATGIVTGDW